MDGSNSLNVFKEKVIEVKNSIDIGNDILEFINKNV